jgi:hypothetical protein
MRVVLVSLLAVLTLTGCSQVAALFEPAPADLLAKASANLQAAKTAHIDGTGAFSLKGGLSVSFDFKFSGDAEMPDKSRMNVQMSLFGQNLSIDTITVDGRTFTKDLVGPGWSEGGGASPVQGAGTLDPLGQMDLSSVSSVKEIDRPQVDGKVTRHLAYTVDAQKLIDKLKQSGASQAFMSDKLSNMKAEGEIWIRTEDAQIVRQSVKMAFDLDLSSMSFPSAAATSAPASGSFEASFDVKLSNIGQPLSPAIMAPPVVAPAPRSPAPIRTLPPIKLPPPATPRPTA